MFPSRNCCNFHPCVLDFFPLFIVKVSAGSRDLCRVFGRMQDTSGFQILVWPWRSQKGRRSVEESERWATWVCDRPPSSPCTPSLRTQRADHVEGPGVPLWGSAVVSEVCTRPHLPLLPRAEPGQDSGLLTPPGSTHPS